MDGSTFDKLARLAGTGNARRGVLKAGFAAVLMSIGASPLPAAGAARALKTAKCQGLKKSCNPHNKNKKCCSGFKCGEILGLDGKHCCRRVQGECNDAGDCCGDFICDQITGMGNKTRCCGAFGRTCRNTDDCCEGFTCNTGQCA